MEITTMIKFHDEDYGSIRVMVIDGQPWFVAQDIEDSIAVEEDIIKKEVFSDDKIVRRYQGKDILLVNEPGAFTMVEWGNSSHADGLRDVFLKSILPVAWNVANITKAASEPSHEIEKRYYTPEQLARIVGLGSADAVNHLLEKKGLQVKKDGKWIPTEKGKKYGKWM